MRKLFDLQHPFFDPLWRRVATVVFTAGWALFELISGSPGWALMFGATAVYCGYEFFFRFEDRKSADPGKQTPDHGSDREDT